MAGVWDLILPDAYFVTLFLRNVRCVTRNFSVTMSIKTDAGRCFSEYALLFLEICGQANSTKFFGL